MSELAAAGEQRQQQKRKRSWLRNPRVWIGVAISAVTLWLTLRDVPFRDVARIMGQANWVILLSISIPSYLAVMFLRALRWRHLTDPIQRIATGPLFRANAVGFMANNIFPLRIGEIVRCWHLARETNTRTAAILGTVSLERFLDMISLVAIVFAAIALGGFGTPDDALLARGTAVLLPLAVVPILFLSAMRAAPDRSIGMVLWFARPLPERFSGWLEGLLHQFARGLGALRSGSHLFWIAFHSASIWLIASALPFLAGFWAMGVHFESARQAIAAAWITIAAVGVAIAIPSAPGFFGPYHLAFKEALSRFGVAEAKAIAVATLVHAVFWVTITALGLIVLRLRRTSLSDLDQATANAGKGSPAESR